MPAEVKVTVTSHFDEISRKLEDRVKDAVKEGANLVAADAKDRVPVRTGALRDAIHVEFEGGSDYAVVAGDETAFYGHIVEFGSVFASAHPFLVPAFEGRSGDVEKLVSEALRKL